MGVWVMNVVPSDAKHNTLGVIYERGLIGTYQNWCEAFSTYPRTYDLIHAAGLVSMYQDRCDLSDILLEMDRILRPEGTVIFRDTVDVLVKVEPLTKRKSLLQLSNIGLEKQKIEAPKAGPCFHFVFYVVVFIGFGF